MRIQKMRKIRVNWTLKPRNVMKVKAMAEIATKSRRKKVSISQIVDSIIEQKCIDPISARKEERKTHIDAVNRLTDEIRQL